MSRKGSTLKGEREILGRELSTVVHGLTGRQAITLEVWSLAPTDHMGREGTRRGKASDTEAVWAAGSDGSFYWVYFDHRTDEVLYAHETRQRTYRAA
jgi:hypothetical protein